MKMFSFSECSQKLLRIDAHAAHKFINPICTVILASFTKLVIF